jgi:hypothetical protein
MHFPLVMRANPPKRGVGGFCAGALAVGASWYYDWGRMPAPCMDENGIDEIEAIPMLWGDWERKGWQSVPPISDGCCVMGQNEPDLSPQSDTTPERGAELWWMIQQTYPHRFKVAPAPSQLHREWIVDMRSEFIAQRRRPPDFDALAVHGYFSNADDLIALVEWYIALAHLWRVPTVWVTEFAFPPCMTGSLEKSIAEAEKARAWFEAEPMVGRYAWFMDYQETDPKCDTSLLTKDGQLTSFGKWYKEAQ